MQNKEPVDVVSVRLGYEVDKRSTSKDKSAQQVAGKADCDKQVANQCSTRYRCCRDATAVAAKKKSKPTDHPLTGWNTVAANGWKTLLQKTGTNK